MTLEKRSKSLITFKKQAALGIATLVGVGALLTGCTTSTSSPAASGNSTAACSIEGKNIQFVSMLREHPVIQIWAAGFAHRAEELGAKHTELLSQGTNAQDSVTLGQQAIAQGSDGMVIVAFDEQWYPLIAEAKAAGIPVVVTHQPTAEGVAPGIVSNIATDVSAYGKSAADFIGDSIKGVGTVAITQGGFNITEDEASASFTKQLHEKYPNVKVLAPEAEGFDAAQAIAKASSILQANPDVTAAFSTTGAGSQTWAKTSEDTNRKLTIISMDYTRENLELLKAGKVQALIAQPIFEEHVQAVDTLEKIICGENVPYRQSPPSPIITQENMREYFDLLDKIGK